jgi:hypothetical protein
MVANVLKQQRRCLNKDESEFGEEAMFKRDFPLSKEHKGKFYIEN